MVIVLVFFFGLTICGSFWTETGQAASHSCWLPYNILTGTWTTGLHIRTDTFSEGLTIQFWHGSDKYDIVTLNLTNGTWTGSVQNLLGNPALFQSPSLLLFSSTTGKFTLTQFLVNAGSGSPGFGFQTFHSYLTAEGWPHTNATASPLPEQASEFTGERVDVRE